jgi:hypothetical protein
MPELPPVTIAVRPPSENSDSRYALTHGTLGVVLIG